MTRPLKDRRERRHPFVRFLFMDFSVFLRRFILKREGARLARGPIPTPPVPVAQAKAQQGQAKEPGRPLFTTGIERIDQDHQQLTATIRKLQKALHDGSSNEVVLETLDFLVRYSEDHFTLEEAYMKHIDFPGLPAHRESHGKVRATILKLHERIASGDTTVALELSSMLFKYLSDHIMGEDSAYVEHARTRKSM